MTESASPGEIVTERLMENFEELMDFGFTADLEESLDEIAEGKRAWVPLLREFYDPFVALGACAAVTERIRLGTGICPSRIASMRIRTNSFPCT